MGTTVIAGGHGFIGGHLYDFLKEKGKDVVKIPKDIDITDDDFNLDIKNIDKIYHLATRCTNEAIEQQLHDVIDAITIGTMNLLYEAKQHGSTLVFASSFGAFEPNVTGAQGAYNGAKRAMEDYVLRYQGVTGKVIRLPRVYGPNMKKNHFIYQIWDAINAGNTVTPENGSRQLAIAPVNTVVEDMIELMENPEMTTSTARSEVVTLNGLIRKIMDGRLYGME